MCWKWSHSVMAGVAETAVDTCTIKFTWPATLFSGQPNILGHLVKGSSLSNEVWRRVKFNHLSPVQHQDPGESTTLRNYFSGSSKKKQCFFLTLNTLYHTSTLAIVYNKTTNLTHASGGKLSCKLNSLWTLTNLITHGNVNHNSRYICSVCLCFILIGFQ